MTDPFHWRAHLGTCTIVILALLAIFWRDAADMAVIWWTSSTFTHCLFIIPIVGWLIWQRRHEVSALCPRGWVPGLLLIGGAGLLWAIGQAAGVALFRHVALIMMIQASIIAVLGPHVARGLMFPLFYLLFLVPFGDEFVPLLQTVTAKLCMVLLGLVGIPAHIDGVFISIPTGLFEVAEACSGIKFLVAMVAYGTLAANVCFKSWRRRVAFMALAITTPVVANGIRAFGTIYISHLTTNDFAASFDHVIYGWFFFGAVMITVMAVSWRFFDRSVDDPWIEDVKPGAARPAKPLAGLVIAVVAIAAVPVAWQSAVAASGRTPMPITPALPDIDGWKPVPFRQQYAWWPRFAGADHKVMVQYENAQGGRVELAVAIFAWQAERREIVGYGQGAVDPETRWSWANNTPPPRSGRAVRIFAPGVSREVVIFYVVGGKTMGDPASVKLETLKTRLIGGDQSAVAVIVSAEDTKQMLARPMIDAFLKALGPADVLAQKMVAVARGNAS